MIRTGWVGMLGAVCLGAVASCGDDDSASGGPLAGKTLSSLTADDVEDLCSDLIGIVRDSSSPERQCVAGALDTTDSEAECNDVRASCLRAEEYIDYDNVRCRSWTSAPDFDCDTKVSEVEACYEQVADWLDGLRCSQAGDAPDSPDCVSDLVDDCSFGFSTLLTDGSEDVDAGAGDAGGGAAGRGGSGGGSSGSGGAGGGGSGEEYTCRDGTQSVPYDFGLGAECNACGAESCCDSFVDCQNDTACLCFWECLNGGEVDSAMECFGPCNISAYPSEFADHAVCLDENCRAPCGLDT